ncbi:MAG: response regulator [Flavobacteriales bacterium]
MDGTRCQPSITMHELEYIGSAHGSFSVPPTISEEMSDEDNNLPDVPPLVMVVDDDADLLQLAKSALERNGFQVDARTKAPSWQDLVKLHPTVVFMDVELGGENGLEICKAIKENPRLSDVPVILISGHGEVRLNAEAGRCRADGFMSKPFSSRLLVQIAEHYSSN